MVRPVRELKGFEKVTLEPGEEREIVFTIDESMLRFHTEKNGFASETGDFLVLSEQTARRKIRRILSLQIDRIYMIAIDTDG